MDCKVDKNDFYIFLNKHNKDEDILRVIRLKNKIELLIDNDDEISCILIPNLIKQLPMSDFNYIEIDDIYMDSDNCVHLSLDIDSQFLNVKFDCSDLKYQKIYI